jgi:hypothetical protein
MKASPYEIPRSMEAPMLMDGSPDYVICEHNESYLAVGVTPIERHLLVKLKSIPNDVSIRTHPVENHYLSGKIFYSAHPVLEFDENCEIHETNELFVYRCDLLTKAPPDRMLLDSSGLVKMIENQLEEGWKVVPFRFPMGY